MAEPRYRWVIVAAGGWLGCVAMGAMFSLPVFQLPVSKATGWSLTGVSSAMTFAFLAMAVGSFAWGTLSDRIGPRPVVGGMIYDTTGSFSGLYVGSTVVGLLAVLIALTFRPSAGAGPDAPPPQKAVAS